MAYVNHVALVFAVFIVCCSSASLLNFERQCSRYSPEEIWYADYAPWINSTILEELRIYFKIIFGRLEDGHLFTFAPHFKNDTEKARELEEMMENARKKALSMLPRSMDIMERAWLKIGEDGRRFVGGKLNDQEAARLIDDLSDSFNRANKVLSEAGREVAIFFRSMMEIAVEGVSQIIDAELEANPEAEVPQSEIDVAKLIQEKIIKIAPDNLVGVVVRRFIGRSLGTVMTSPSKEKPNVLYSVMPRIEKLVNEFKADFEKDPLTPESWTDFWHRMAQHSIDTIIKRQSEPKEDYVLIYRNEVYLAEVLMNIMTMY